MPKKDLDLNNLNLKLSKMKFHERLLWGIKTFPHKSTLGCSFGGEGGIVLSHALSQINSDVPVFYLDTSLLFPETYAFAKKLSKLLNLNTIALKSQLSLEDQTKKHGEKLWESDPKKCCQLRKVKPQLDFLKDYELWITGIRRGQTKNRNESPFISFDEKFGVYKLAPIADLSDEELSNYIKSFQLPTNPLKKDGFLSIGCWPCTSRVNPGDDPRSGRWKGKGKTECGLHLI